MLKIRYVLIMLIAHLIGLAGVANAQSYGSYGQGIGRSYYIIPGSDYRPPIPRDDSSQRYTAVDYFSSAYKKHTELNDLRGALADYNEAIALNPKKDAEIYYFNRGRLKYDVNDLRGSLDDFSKAITLKPNFAEAYFGRGGLKYTKLNDIQGALVDYNKAIALKPNYAEAYYGRGDILYMANRRAEALQNFRKISEMGAAGWPGLMATGILASEQGDFTSAITSFNQVIKTEQAGDGFKYRGLAYRRQGQTAKAIQDWQQAAQFYKVHNATKDYQIVRGWLREVGVK